MFFSLLNILFVFCFFSLELHERVRQYCVFFYIQQNISMFTIVRPNCSPMRMTCAVLFFFLKCLERDPNALVDHKSTD